MTGVPPSFRLPDQLNPIWVPDVSNGRFTKSIGGVGTVKITAPFPDNDSSDVPYTLEA